MANKSPFPGMDPWLEQYWGDVHQAIVTYARDALAERLPPGLKARMQDQVYVECLPGESREIYPDIRVIENGRGRGRENGVSGSVATAEPFIMHLQEIPPESYIEITDSRTDNRVITVIEVLSLTNKLPGKGQESYLRKQRELIDGEVSLVEIDLLRKGRWVLSVDRIPESHRTTYQVCARRSYRPLEAEVYRVPLREPLPTIRIPLRPTDADAPLNLQAIFEMAYRNGGYEDTDYRRDPIPPLDKLDADWADELLRARGRR